ncbi:unnamed protein product, partial [Ectocarpus fasciculatus]
GFAEGGAGQPVQLMAVAELERRHTSVEGHVQAEVSEMRNELAEALLRVEQLSAQESLLKSTIRALETDLVTERNLGSGETAPINVAYLKSAVVRYMSTRDAGEQRSLLRVISTILQFTKQEVADVEARITELEKTMVRMCACCSFPFALSPYAHVFVDLHACYVVVCSAHVPPPPFGLYSGTAVSVNSPWQRGTLRPLPPPLPRPSVTV